MVAIVAVVSSASAAEPTWSRFRGPNGSGVAESFSPPASIDPSKPAWKTPAPAGHSSPVIWGDAIYLTGVDEGRLTTWALDRASGDVLWKRKLPEMPLERVHAAGSPAASSPCADERGVYVYFGSFGLISYGHDGGQRWTRKMAAPRSMYGMSTSPIVHGNKVIMVLDNDRNLPGSQLSASKAIAAHRDTGETIWETPRPRHRSGWSTPAVWRHDEGVDLVVLGNGRVYGYDPGTGEEKWFVGGFTRETVAVPVVGAGRVYVSVSRQGGWGDERIDPEPFWKAALKFDRDGDGRVGKDEIGRHFTVPFRPDLPPGHPGFGMPLPKDPKKRKERQLGLFAWRDSNRDGFWTHDEFVKDMTVGRGRPNLAAIRPGGRGDVTESHVDWNLRSGIPEVPSPVYWEGRLYLIRDGGILSCVDVETGGTIYRERTGAGSQYSASPVLADGRLYVVSNRGVVTVVSAGDEFKVEHQADLNADVNATPAMDRDSLYIRTADSLIAFR